MISGEFEVFIHTFNICANERLTAFNVVNVSCESELQALPLLIEFLNKQSALLGLFANKCHITSKGLFPYVVWQFFYLRAFTYSNYLT